MRPIESVSIVLPMRDEREHVAGLVSSLAGQDYSGPLEIIVGDGGSTDGSVELLQEHARRAELDLRVIVADRASGSTSENLNRCIRAATGDLIVRMDCHSVYPPDYVRACVAASSETGAWNVGGTVRAQGHTRMQRAVAAAMTSPFGGIGWTRHRSVDGRTEVDTVTFGAFDPEAFRRAGMFDTELVRNQDDELNLRLRRSGGRIVLDPAIRMTYTPRGSLPAVFRQYYEYGLWKVPVMLKHRRPLTLRSLAPLTFVGSAGLLAALAPTTATARVLLALELVSYAALATGFAVSAARRAGDAQLMPRILAAFAAFHLGYGIGMARGWLLVGRWQRIIRSHEQPTAGVAAAAPAEAGSATP